MSWKRKRLERRVVEGDSPVRDSVAGPTGILSSAGHVKSRVKRAGPPAKAKYSPETDSGPVP